MMSPFVMNSCVIEMLYVNDMLGGLRKRNVWQRRWYIFQMGSVSFIMQNSRSVSECLCWNTFCVGEAWQESTFPLIIAFTQK